MMLRNLASGAYMRSLWNLLFAVLLALPAGAQTSAGTISGTVRDQTGSVIPNATVVMLNTATNVRSSTVSNESGFYRLPSVAPGQYLLTAEAAGMQKYEGNVAVQVGQSVVINAVLLPAGTVTTVEVKDVTPLVTTDNAMVGAGME